MKQVFNLLAMITVAVVATLSITSCGNQNKAAGPSLLEEQQKVCDFIVKMFGEPKGGFSDIDHEDVFRYHYEKMFYDEEDMVREHCSPELQKRLNEAFIYEFTYDSFQKPDDAYSDYLTSEFGLVTQYDDMICYPDHCVECIYIDGDWYTYIVYQFGCIGYRKIHAKVVDGMVVIDDIYDDREDDNSNSYIQLWGEGREDSETWVRAGWKDQSGRLVYLFNDNECLQVDFSFGAPVFLKLPYTIEGNIARVELANGSMIEFEKKKETVIMQKDTKAEFEMIREHPLIIVAE